MSDSIIARGRGKNLLVQETRTVELDYIDLDEAIVRLRQAGKGLDNCVLEIDHDLWGGYEGCSVRVYVRGWRPATKEDRARIKERDREQQQKERDREQRLAESLRNAGYKVEKT